MSQKLGTRLGKRVDVLSDQKKFILVLFFSPTCALLTPISLLGYLEEILGPGKVWRASEEESVKKIKKRGIKPSINL